MSRDAAAEFVPLFHAAMASKDARRALDTFIKSLNGPEAKDCVSAYFKAAVDPTRRYSRSDKLSLSIFVSLLRAALDLGEPLYAVRVDALVDASGTPWQERYSCLDSGQQDQLRAGIAKKLRALGRTQRRFLELFQQAIRQGHTGDIEGFTSKLSFQEAHACLLAYLEASLRYPPEHTRSLLVFYGVSILVINKGDGDFVKQYRRLVGVANSTWQLRWNALDQDLRKRIEKDLADKALKASLIAAGRAKNDQPISVVTPSPASLPADALRRDEQAKPATNRSFLELFAKFMRAPGNDKDAQKRMSEFIMKQKPLALRGCLDAYLEASEAYPADSARSLYLFWGIASRLVHIGTAYEALKLDLLRKTEGTVIFKRFEALKIGAAGAAGAGSREWGILNDEIALRMKNRHVLDDLKLAYFQVHRADAELDALRRFEPALDPALRDSLRISAGECDRAFGQRDPDSFSKRFDAWAKLMHAQQDPVTHLMMLKWCRESLDIAPVLRAELYWYGVLALQITALKRFPKVYDRGLGAEEKAFLLDPGLVPQAYRYDFERRMEQVFWKRTSPDQLLAVSRAHALLLFTAQKMGFTLVPMDEAAAVREQLNQLRIDKPKSLREIRIPVASRSAAREVQLGDKIGNLWIVWWDRKHSHVFVEADGLGRVLFRLDSYLTLGRLTYEDATYGQIWRSTQHLLTLISGFYQVLGYLPDLVSGGFAGLVTSVVTDLLVNEFAEAADLGPGATMLLGLGAHALSGRLLEGARETSGAHAVMAPEEVVSVTPHASGSPALKAEGPLIVDLQSGPMMSESGPSFLSHRVNQTPGARGVGIEPGDYALGYAKIQPTGTKDLEFSRMLTQNLPEWPSTKGLTTDWAEWRMNPESRFPKEGKVSILQEAKAPTSTPPVSPWPELTPQPQAFASPVSKSGSAIPLDQNDVAGLRPSTHPELHGKVDEAYWRRPFALKTADAAAVDALGSEINRMLKPGGFVEFRVLPANDVKVVYRIAEHVPGMRAVEVPQKAIDTYVASMKQGVRLRPQGLNDEQWSLLKGAESDLMGEHGQLGKGFFNRIVRIYKGVSP